MRVLGVGRARAARAGQAQHRDGEGCLHRRRDDRAAATARRGGERPAMADRLLDPEPARRRHVRRRSRSRRGCATTPARSQMSPTHRRTTRTCRPSPPVSRATSTRGGRYSRRSRGSRPTGSSITRCSARSTGAREGARCAAGVQGLREHDRGLHLRPRRHARRPRWHAPEVAQRLRGDDPRAVHRRRPADPGGRARSTCRPATPT